MKLWVDDIRRPPKGKGWDHWARTCKEAELVLLSSDITECSLDHDMGLHNHDPDVPDADIQAAPDSEYDGMKLARWMCENDLVPAAITIHSWNPVGAQNMAAEFASYWGATGQEGVLIILPYEGDIDGDKS